MTQRVYRSAQGKLVDLGALQLKNEGIRAIGNLPVNARGDLIDSYNRPIDAKGNQVSKQYQKQVTNVSDDVVVTSKKQVVKEQPVVQQTTSQVDQSENTVKVENTKDSNSGGLAAAIAKARQVKQSTVQTESQQLRQTSGVKKI